MKEFGQFVIHCCGMNNESNEYMMNKMMNYFAFVVLHLAKKRRERKKIPFRNPVGKYL